MATVIVSSNLHNFSKRMSKIGKKVQRRSLELQRKTAFAVYRGVVVNTPVDTGRARTNWQMGSGTPATGTVDAVLGVAASFTRAQSTAQTHKQGSIFITNNLPYIGRLNDGWSKQAPANFVEQAAYSAWRTVRNYSLISGKG